ncbi:MAG: metallophosphoesterase family protein [Anaerolineae bacterium]|nr:metallophosphoesterase family protein [Anaerolineae bacterium]
MIRLGIVSDTHYPTRLPRLPYEALEDAFREVDAIVHAGDIESEDVLHHLSEIAPVQAVRGDDDHFSLPLTRVLNFGGVRVGLTHGHFNPVIEEVLRIRRRFGYSGYREMLQRRDWLLGRFEGHNLDVLIFGHAHIPYCEQHKGVLLFNPGAVYTLTLDSAQWQLKREKNPARRRMLRRKIREYLTQPTTAVPRSTVGILEIAEDHAITPRVIDLPLVDYPLVSAASR